MPTATMQPKTIEKFKIESEIADIMAGIYNDYLAGNSMGIQATTPLVTLEDCQQSLLATMSMLDLNDGLDEKINSSVHNEAYYLARELVRLPFDSMYMQLPGNSLDKETREKLATAELFR